MSIMPRTPNAMRGIQGIFAGKGVAIRSYSGATPVQPQKFIMSYLYCLEIQDNVSRVPVKTGNSGMPGSRTGQPYRDCGEKRKQQGQQRLPRSPIPTETCAPHRPGQPGAIHFA